MQRRTPTPSREHLRQAMRRAIELAGRGPEHDRNPRVGCVIITAEGRTLAEGWHRGAGTVHAEVDALEHLPSEWRSRAAELTAVVTLEPCNHTGHTGPCTSALIDAGIGHLAYALTDPGITSGGGAHTLRDAGVQVTSGVGEAEARVLLASWLVAQPHTPLNLRYSTDPSPGPRPHVTVKWAQTLDGRSAAHDGSSQWITGPEARAHVHAERALADAILVGTGTAMVDNPSLTARNRDGEPLVSDLLQPVPVVLGNRELPDWLRVHDHPALTARGLDGPLQFSGRDLAHTLAQLGGMGVRSVYVEGGPTIISALLMAGLADEVHLYLAPTLLGGDGLAITHLGITTLADALHLDVQQISHLGRDLLVTATPRSQRSDV